MLHLKKRRRELFQASGLQENAGFFKNAFRAAKDFARSRKDLLRDNLAREEDFKKMDFGDILARWGIPDEETLRRVIFVKKVEMWCAVALLLVVSAAVFLLPPQSTVWFTCLHSAVMFSLYLLGTTLFMTAEWRLDVLKHRRFVSLWDWLKGNYDDWDKGSKSGRIGMLAMAAVPPVEVSQSDVTVQILDQLFGTGWANLSQAFSAPSEAGPTLIYTILGTFNAACTVAVVWLMILTIIISNVGAAQEGRSLGGKYSSPWIPIRFAFSFAAITPVLAGLNAFQILILAGVGVSIDLANNVWKTGIEYVAEYGGQITTHTPPQVQANAKRLAAGALRSMTLQNYMIAHVDCQFNGSLILDESESDSEIIMAFAVPPICKSDARSELETGDLGGIRFSKSGDASLDQARMNAVYAMLNTIQPAAVHLGADKKWSYADRAAVQAGARAYAAGIAQGLAKLATQEDKDVRAALDNFVNVAGTRGWAMAGSYYWTLSAAASRSIERLRDDAAYFEPYMAKFPNLLYNDWDYAIDPTLAKAADETLMADLEKTAAKIEGTANATDSVWAKIFSFFDWSSVTRGIVKLTAEPASAPDAILWLSRMGHTGMNVAESAITALVAADVAGYGVKEGISSNLAARVADTFTGGAGVGILAGVSRLVHWAVVFGGMVIMPLWGLCWFFAYGLPAMPYLFWLAGVVGWIVLVVEAVIAAPLWLVGHSLPEGDGFAGMGGRAGYMLFFSILIRPALLVCSLFFCILILMCTGKLLAFTFAPFVDSLTTIGGSFGLGVITMVSLFIILGIAISITTWKLFALTTSMPDRIIRWVGQLLHTLGAEGQEVISQTQSGIKTAASQSLASMREVGAELGKAAAQTGGEAPDGGGAPSQASREDNAQREHILGNVKEKGGKKNFD